MYVWGGGRDVCVWDEGKEYVCGMEGGRYVQRVKKEIDEDGVCGGGG